MPMAFSSCSTHPTVGKESLLRFHSFDCGFCLLSVPKKEKRCRATALHRAAPMSQKAIAAFIFFGASSFAFAQEPDFAALREKPITTAQGKLGDLLREWW